MFRKRKELPPKEPQNIPLLREAEKEPIHFMFQTQRKRRLKRWYRIYMLTTTTALLLCLAVLISGVHSGNFSTGSSDLFSDIASWIGLSDLLDPSDQDGEDREEGLLPDVLDGFLLPGEHLPGNNGESEDSDSESLPDNGTKPPLSLEHLYQFDYTAVPEGETPIVPMDLSLISYGAGYIYNTTGLKPDTEALLKADLKKEESLEYLTTAQAPRVLIVHTHGTEAYSPNGAISYLDNGQDLARSTDLNENVVSVGKILADSLNRAGISTMHCTVMHDQAQYKDSYLRAEETIRKYLEKYPTIQLVIDVHRDSIVKSTGELVRPVTLVNGEAAAQVMCVVGSDWGGQDNPNWEGNLSLALKLRELLNSQYNTLCRPPYLRSSTYNQELAPYSLLLEVGASGNSLEEAKRSANVIAEALIQLIPQF